MKEVSSILSLVLLPALAVSGAAAGSVERNVLPLADEESFSIDGIARELKKKKTKSGKKRKSSKKGKSPKGKGSPKKPEYVLTQLGNDIAADGSFDLAGRTVGLNEDGTVMAIGNTFAGSVTVYAWNECFGWIRVGDTIEEGSGRFGVSVALSNDGKTLAVRANTHGEQTVGLVRVYCWDGEAWVQMGDDIPGVSSFD